MHRNATFDLQLIFCFILLYRESRGVCFVFSVFKHSGYFSLFINTNAIFTNLNPHFSMTGNQTRDGTSCSVVHVCNAKLSAMFCSSCNCFIRYFGKLANTNAVKCQNLQCNLLIINFLNVHVGRQWFKKFKFYCLL